MKRIEEVLLAIMREHILGAVADKSLFSSEQQRQLAERVAQCADVRQLTRWLAQARQEAVNRYLCRKAAREVAREQAAVVDYVRNPAGRLVPRPAGNHQVACQRVHTN